MLEGFNPVRKRLQMPIEAYALVLRREWGNGLSGLL